MLNSNFNNIPMYFPQNMFLSKFFNSKPIYLSKPSLIVELLLIISKFNSVISQCINSEHLTYMFNVNFKEVNIDLHQHYDIYDDLHAYILNIIPNMQIYFEMFIILHRATKVKYEGQKIITEMGIKVTNSSPADIKYIDHWKFGPTWYIGEYNEVHKEFDGTIAKIQKDINVRNEWKLCITKYSQFEPVNSYYVKYSRSEDPLIMIDEDSGDDDDSEEYNQIKNATPQEMDINKLRNCYESISQMNQEIAYRIFGFLTLPIEEIGYNFYGRVHYSVPYSLCYHDYIYSNNKRDERSNYEYDSVMIRDQYYIYEDYEIIDWNKCIEQTKDDLCFYMYIEILDKNDKYIGKFKVGEELVFDSNMNFIKKKYYALVKIQNTLRLYIVEKERYDTIADEYQGWSGIKFKYFKNYNQLF